jgi:hypothetical protein
MSAVPDTLLPKFMSGEVRVVSAQLNNHDQNVLSFTEGTEVLSGKSEHGIDRELSGAETNPPKGNS